MTLTLYPLLAMAPAGDGAGGGDLFASMVPLIAIMFIIYFLMIRPEQKRRSEHKSFLENLKRGDQVVTSGGIIGKVTGITDTIVTLEIAPKVTIKVQRAQISGASGDASAPKDDGEKKSGKKKKAEQS